MDSVITAIHQCLQRGERPLSVVDLIEKDFLTLTQAAWLVSRVKDGSSWLAGAIPSHAGKTTLMNALLAFLPAQEQVTMAYPGQSWESYAQNCCVIAEEISDHGKERYLWDEDVRRFTSIPARGGRIASTIHATTLEQVREQVREQVARQCVAGEYAMAAFGLFIPIEVGYAPEQDPMFSESEQGSRHRQPIISRTVEHIHYHNGAKWNTIGREVDLTERQEEISGFLRSCLDTEVRSCEALRKAWLAECSAGSH